MTNAELAPDITIPLARPRSSGSYSIRQEREADDPRHRVCGTLGESRDEQGGKVVRVGQHQRGEHQPDQAADERAPAANPIRHGALRDRDTQRRRPEGREQQSDGRGRRAELPG